MRGRKLLSRIIVPAATGVFCFYALALIKSLPVVAAAAGAAEALNRAIDRLGCNYRTSALMKALLTGNRSCLESSTLEIFRRSGASHLLALSGLHLGFIYSIIRNILRIMGNGPVIRAVRVGLVMGFCSFYAIMTGAGPSIVRSLLFIVANETCSLDPERKKSGIGVLALALTVQIAAMPDVVHTISFQLSYLAMAGIFLVGLPMQKWFPGRNRYNLLKRIWDTAAISISCQIFTAPLSWYYFHSFPLHFLIANIIALPVTEMALALSILTIATGGCNFQCNPLPDICNHIYGLLVRILETISRM